MILSTRGCKAMGRMAVDQGAVRALLNNQLAHSLTTHLPAGARCEEGRRMCARRAWVPWACGLRDRHPRSSPGRTASGDAAAGVNIVVVFLHMNEPFRHGEMVVVMSRVKLVVSEPADGGGADFALATVLYPLHHVYWALLLRSLSVACMGAIHRRALRVLSRLALAYTNLRAVPNAPAVGDVVASGGPPVG